MAVKTLMTDPVKEQLSACLDGELPEGELDLMLKRVGRDSQLRASLGRYALIGETLRAQRPVAAPADFSKRVADAIAAEPALHTSGQSSRRIQPIATRWLRPLGGLAVAAGVAAMAILAIQQPQQDDPSATYAAQAAAPTNTVTESIPNPAASYIVPTSTASSSIVPAARLTNYVVAHSEYSSPLGRRSVLTGVLAEDAEGTDTDVAVDEAVNESANEP